MMKLNLNSLRANPGVSVPFSGQVALIESNFNEPVTVNEAVQVVGDAAYFPSDVVNVNIEFNVALARPCSRCLNDVALGLDLKDHVAVRGTAEAEVLPDDFNYVLDDEEIDLKPILVSLILSEFEPKPLCRDDCKGLCSSCGADLNNGACQCKTQPDKTQPVKDPRLSGLAELLEDA